VQIVWTDVRPPNPSDDVLVTIWFARTWLARRQLRLELFRNEGERQAVNGTLAGPARGRGYNLISISRRHSELREFAAGSTFLLAGVAEEGRDLLAQDRIELAQLDMALQTLAAAQPRLDAMVADYRRACRPFEEVIIVT